MFFQCVLESFEAADVASAFNIASFNIGIALGAYMGGLVVVSPLGIGATPWVGAVFVAVAIVLTVLSLRLEKKAQ